MPGELGRAGAGHPPSRRHSRVPSIAEHVLANCDCAERSWYDGVGHLPFLEDPERFDGELADFAIRII